jgi:polysaccharide export outer membrane protein
MVRIASVLAALALAGCTNLPVAGPAPRDIAWNATERLAVSRHDVAFDYILVDLSETVLGCIPEISPGSLFGSFGGHRLQPPDIKVGAGDVVQVSIFESSAGGLFIPAEAGVRPGNFVTLPNQTVGRAGRITVPYAGEVRATGRTALEIKREIEEKLASRAVEPQVVVTMVEQTATAVSVVGDTLYGANKFQIRPSERILDMISRAGGIRYPGYELFVTLQRKQKRATIYFPALVNAPRENLYVQPGDSIYVFREPQKFVAVGALGSGSQTSGVTGQFTFDQERLSLNEAVAKAGGLLDTRANASKVYLYRMEAREAVERMGANTSSFPPGQKFIPVIYRANYRDPSSFFLAQRFQMRHKDSIYVANADSVELEKFLTHTRAITSTISGMTTDGLIVRDAIGGGRVLLD